MFWSGDKLNRKLSILVKYKDSKLKPKVDCASIELTVGHQVLIPDDKGEFPSGHQYKTLADNDKSFKIPKGQFIFILTEEIVSIPTNAIGFISFKAKYKFKGLINVSGFHVDPGYNGRLIFSLYNAGPQDITLNRADKFALLWIADLDSSASKKFAKGNIEYNSEIPSDLINNISGEVFSPIRLKNEIDATNNRISSTRYIILAVVLVALLTLGFRGYQMFNNLENKLQQDIKEKYEFNLKQLELKFDRELHQKHKKEEQSTN